MCNLSRFTVVYGGIVQKCTPQIPDFVNRAILLRSRVRFGTLVPMETKLYVANRVREIRSRLKMRQQDLADLVGVSRQTIISIERGRLFNPTVHTCLMLSRVLREPVDFLFYLVPHRETAPEPTQELVAANADLVHEDELSLQETTAPPEREAAAESAAEGADRTGPRPAGPEGEQAPFVILDRGSARDITQERNAELVGEPDEEDGGASAQAVWDFSRA